MKTRITLLGALLLAIVIFSGCQKTDIPIPSPQEAEMSVPEYHEVFNLGAAQLEYALESYCTEYAPMTSLTSLALSPQGVIGAGYSVDENYIADGQLWCAVQTQNSCIPIGNPLGKEVTVQDIGASGDGTIWALLATGAFNLNTQSYEETYSLASFAADGEQLSNTRLPDKYCSGAGIGSLAISNENVVYINVGEEILCFNMSSKCFQQSVVPESYCFELVSDGMTAYGLFFDDDGPVLHSIAVQETDKKIAHPNASTNIWMLNSDTPNLLYYIDNWTLFRLHIETSVSEQVLCLTDVGINDLSLGDPLVWNDQFLFIARNAIGDGIYSLVPLDEPEERIELYYATAEVNDPLLDAVAGFNRTSPSYFIQVWDYSESCQTGQDLLQAIKKEVAFGGKSPDLVNCQSADQTELLQFNLAEDLFPRLEASQATSSDALLSGIMKALRAEGATYSLPTSVAIISAYCKADFVSESTTLSAFDEIAKNRKMDLFAGESSESYLHDCYGFGLAEVSGWADLLAYIPDNAALDYHAIRQNHAIIGVDQFQNLSDFFVLESYKIQDKIELIGFPCTETPSPFLLPLHEIAILQTSSQKDGAWEFCEYVLSDNCQQLLRTDGFPVCAKTLGKLIEHALNTANSSEYGESISIDGESYAIKSMTQDVLSKYQNWICSADQFYRTNTAIRSILSDESEYIRTSQNNYSDAAALLEKRISLVLNES